MSEPKLDLTALSDALGEGEKPSITGESKKAQDDLSAIDSPTSLTPSPTPTPFPAKTDAAVAVPSPMAAARQRNPSAQMTNPDPNVQNIKAMFPDMDVDTIQAVLAADGGNFEQAINTLLQMSDPTYVPPPPFQRNSQQDQDEQLARSIAAQEEQGMNARPPASRGGGGFASFLGGGGSNSNGGNSSPSYDPNQLTYQPRVKRTTSGLQAQTSSVNQQQPYHQNNLQTSYRTDSTSSNNTSGAWPGPKEAKEWQNDINRLAETGFAKAASTFSALRQRGETAFTGLRQGQQQQQAPQDPYSTPASSWSSRKPATMSNTTSTFSPTIGSNRGFDKDPAPVGDDELAKILARGREDNKKPSIVERYKNASRSNSTNSTTKADLDDDNDELGWDDAGRTGNEKEKGRSTFEPIRVSNNSADSTASKSERAKSPRNAVSLMEGSAGRGLTSHNHSSTDKIDDDDDDDGNDLEYVSNPFEDED